MSLEEDAEIAAFATNGNADAKRRITEGFLSAGGQKDIGAYNTVQGLLFEIRRRTEVARASGAQTGEAARSKVKVTFTGVTFTEEGWRLAERTSEAIADIPELDGHVYEVKRYPRLDWGLGNDGAISRQALNQVIKYDAMVKGKMERGATIEVSGNISPDFFQLLARFAPNVEVLYALKLPSGSEVAFRIKEASPDAEGRPRPTLRRVPDIRALPEAEQKVLDGIRRFLNSGRIFRDGVFQSSFLKLADVPETDTHYEGLKAATSEDGSVNPKKIDNLATFKAWETKIYQKRLKYFGDKSTEVPLRRDTAHLTKPVTDAVIDEYLGGVERFLSTAPPPTVKQYGVKRDSPEWVAVRTEFARRLRDIQKFEQQRLGVEGDPKGHAGRQAMGYTGPREGYSLDPVHI